MRGPFLPGHRLVAYNTNAAIVKFTVTALTETGKIRGRPSWEDDKMHEVEIDPSQVILEFPRVIGQPQMRLKDLLLGLWGNLVFGRVTRIVARAQDVNIWHQRDGQRQYLGDNREVLKRFTRDEIREYITFEYDFYYGFCGALGKGPFDCTFY
jgi:hypothetical protein